MGKKVKVYYDAEMDTLDIWFDDPPEEGFSREINEGVIVKYDLKGRMVGIEILFLSRQKPVVDVMPDEVKKAFRKNVTDFLCAVKVVA
jgi:uncharacterized protein YuzE